MKDQQEWLERCEWHAARGDPECQLALAWTYWEGDLVQKDLRIAEHWFRRAEETLPDRARFELAKMWILERDPRYADVLEVDCEQENGAALFLHATVALHGKLGHVDREKGIDYLRRASRSHLLSRFYYWRRRRMSLWERLRTTPQAIALFWRIVRLRYGDSNDARVRD